MEGKTIALRKSTRKHMPVPHRYRVEETIVPKQSTRKPTSQPQRDTESQAPAEKKTEEQDAPTLKVALQRARQTIEGQKKEIESLKEKIVFLDEDRNYLRERLRDALAPKGDTTRSSMPDEQMPVARSSAHLRDKRSTEDSEDSDSSSEESSSQSDSSPARKKKKQTKKKMKKSKKAKKMGRNKRVKTPEDSIERYDMVLQLVSTQKMSKSEAYARLNVDRNTIVSQAPISELAKANPEVYSALRATFKRKGNIKRFADECRAFCEKEPTSSLIAKKKDEGALLDICKI